MGMTGAILGTGLDLAMSIPTYVDDRKKGHGVAYSAGKMALDFVLWDAFAPVMWGITGAQIASAVGQFGMQVGKNSGSTMSNAYRANFGGNFTDTKNAYTMRQRGMQAIESSRMNARTTLGSEARMYHRGVTP